VAKAKGSKLRLKASTGKAPKVAETYTHPEQTVSMRPDVGTQAQFRKKKPPATYRYDSSLSPALDWDGQNGSRELGEWLLACIEDASLEPAPHDLSPHVPSLGPTAECWSRSARSRMPLII
jgi:hypothetical protein